MHLGNIKMGEPHKARYLMPSLGTSPSQHFNVFISLEAFWTLLFRGYYGGGGSFCTHDWLNPWSLVINSIASPSPIPRGRGGGDLLVPPLMIPWSFWWPAPILKLLRPPATTYLTSIQKTRHLGHSKGFRICVPVT